MDLKPRNKLKNDFQLVAQSLDKEVLLQKEKPVIKERRCVNSPIKQAERVQEECPQSIRHQNSLIKSKIS